ncbi:anti-CBASS protein Acb1 family protein [Phyllobacterium ifriqiyense]|uniref:anti-CBASS protein Acb1 family protein n=1 Tax=Phyllobacterium ifriqiyense TaxID=314238 RepID=UPI0033914216
MNAIQSIRNTVVRRLDTMFPGFFAQSKHNHYADFGFPTDLTFKQLYDMYTRNGIAHAGVEKTILKTWQDMPFLLEKERDGSEGKETKETKIESDIRQRFDDLRFWQQLSEADRRSLVGAYSGVILRLADSKKFQEPVDTVPGGLLGLVELIPAWEGQLQVSEWDTDETSENYGHPKMYQFTESQINPSQKVQRQFQLHPDRVLIWSRDGTVHNRSLLEPGYNDLMTLEKVSGAGGEGFWKNAKSAPVFEIDKEASLENMARAMGVPLEDIADRMDEQVKDWQKGFDQLLMVQGMQAKTLGITLPSPEHFFAIALQSFAASIPIPMKILVGSQTGERASTEDAEEWAQTNMSRRTGQVIPNTMSLINRLERFNILPEKDWFLQWTDLTESSIAEKIDRAGKMADVNQKMKDTGEFVFTPEEIRAAVDYEPLADGEKYRDTDTDDEKEGAQTPPAKTPAKEETQ